MPLCSFLTFGVVSSSSANPAATESGKPMC